MEDARLEAVADTAESIPAAAPEDAAPPREEVSTPAPEVAAEDTPDYAALASADLSALKEEFAHLTSLCSLAELPDPGRYGELRELGLTPKEAYLAIGGTVRRASDNRAHLTSAVPRTSALGADLPTTEQMAEARRIFTDLSDEQIYRLYKKVVN